MLAKTSKRTAAILALLATVVAAAAFGAWQISQHRAVERHAAKITGGEPPRGRELLIKLGCVTCHLTPGVPGTPTESGPSFQRFGTRAEFAVGVENTPGNLIAFIRDPRAIAPQSAMPKLPMSEQDARDMAAFLFTLQ